MEIIEDIKKTIERYGMLSEGDHVLIGLSGGPDSVCLSLVLKSFRGPLKLSLSALYIDHGLRGEETLKELSFCREVCRVLGIEFLTKKINVKKLTGETGINLQEAARELRYKEYSVTAGEIKASRIALGHNADDQAETVLMRLFRGAGRKGLSGIPPVRGDVIRPLIGIERDRIEEFLVSEGDMLPMYKDRCYMIDSSNLEDKYYRNWLRNRILPMIKDRNPSLIKDICRTASVLGDEDMYLETIVTKTLMRLISRKNDSSIQLFLSPLRTIELPLLRRVLRRAVDAVRGLRGISYTNIEDITGLIKNGMSGDRLDLPGGIRVILEYSLLVITLEKPQAVGEYELGAAGETLVSEAGIIIRSRSEDKGGEPGDGRSSIVLDGGLLEFPLSIRARKRGDFFYPSGMGKRKKLQDFFVDEKVPRDKRDSVPVVLSGNEIVWVAGYRADDRFKVTDKTEKYLRLEIINK